MGRQHASNNRVGRDKRGGLLGFSEVATVFDRSAGGLEKRKRDHEARRHGLTLVFEKDAEVAAWVASKLPLPFRPEDFGPCTTIGMNDKNGKLVAGCVYHRWRPFDCEVTFASVTPRWTLPMNLAPLFHYPFVQHKLSRLTLIIGANNQNALRTNLRIGFKWEGRARKAYDGTNDAIILGMLREECDLLEKDS